MKHCPHCHYEYEDWATTCSDCEGALEPGPPPAPEVLPVIDTGQFREWVIATNVPNTMLGTLLKDQLEQAGIPVLMKRAHATDVAEWTHNDFAWHDLYVPRHLAVRARRLIDSPPSRRHIAEDGGEDAWEEEDEDDAEFEEEMAAGDVLNVPLREPPLPPPDHLSPAGIPLPGLGRYQQTIARRKDHLPPPDARRVIAFPGAPGAHPGAPLPYAAGEADEDDAPRANRAAWSRSRIYRILIGLLFLAWTLPFLLQMLQYFGDAFGRLFP